MLAIFYVCTRRAVDPGFTARIRVTKRAGRMKGESKGGAGDPPAFARKDFQLKTFAAARRHRHLPAAPDGVHICIAVVRTRRFLVESSRYCNNPFGIEILPLSIILLITSREEKTENSSTILRRTNNSVYSSYWSANSAYRFTKKNTRYFKFFHKTSYTKLLSPSVLRNARPISKKLSLFEHATGYCLRNLSRIENISF